MPDALALCCPSIDANSQDARQEHRTERKLLLQWQLQVPYTPDWNYQDAHIREYVDAATDDNEHHLVGASSRKYQWIPGCLPRRTAKDARQRCRSIEAGIQPDQEGARVV